MYSTAHSRFCMSLSPLMSQYNDFIASENHINSRVNSFYVIALFVLCIYLVFRFSTVVYVRLRGPTMLHENRRQIRVEYPPEDAMLRQEDDIVHSLYKGIRKHLSSVDHH